MGLVRVLRTQTSYEGFCGIFTVPAVEPVVCRTHGWRETDEWLDNNPALLIPKSILFWRSHAVSIVPSQLTRCQSSSELPYNLNILYASCFWCIGATSSARSFTGEDPTGYESMQGHAVNVFFVKIA